MCRIFLQQFVIMNIRLISNRIMKKLFVALILTVLFMQLASARVMTHRGKTGLIGPVRTVIEKSSTWENEAIVDSWTITYDSKGNETKSVRALYKVGSATNIKEQKSIYTYDADGKKTEMASYWEDGSLASKTIYAYDTTNNRTVVADYNTDGLPMSRRVYTSDTAGRVIEVIFYNSDNSIISKQVNTYDKKGNMIEETYYKPAGALNSKAINKYDEKGNITKRLNYNADDSLKTKVVYSYNDLGNMTAMAIYDDKDVLQSKETYSYEFDTVENWIKKTTMKWVMKEGKLSPEPSIVTKRTITYYSDQPPH